MGFGDELRSLVSGISIVQGRPSRRKCLITIYLETAETNLRLSKLRFTKTGHDGMCVTKFKQSENESCNCSSKKCYLKDVVAYAQARRQRGGEGSNDSRQFPKAVPKFFRFIKLLICSVRQRNTAVHINETF